MTKLKKLIALLLVPTLLFVSALAQADEKADIAKVRAEIAKMIPQANSAEIVAGPTKGIYRMEVQGNYAYAFVDGDYVLLGDLFNTKDKVNMGDNAKAAKVASLLEETPTSKMIVYGADDAERHITVFTDIDCGYCRKLHVEVPQLIEAGIQVRYLAFPRAGVGSGSYDKYVSVWCNANQQQALTDAKAGTVVVADATCENPIAETYKLGQQVGVRGTPTIIFDDGTITPGYIPAVQLIEKLGLTKVAADKS